MSELAFADVETHLLQHVREGSAAGPIRQVASRTRDVIDAVAQISQFHGHALPEEWDSINVGVQLELGLPQSLVGLTRVLGATLSRGDYLRLMNAGITRSEHLEDVTDATLDELLGRDLRQHIRALLAPR